MAKMLLNYQPTKERIEGLVVIKPLYDREVLLDLPICVVEFGMEYDKPVLFGVMKGLPMVVETTEAVEYLKNNTKMFYLKKNENGVLIEVSEKEAELSFRLPIDTDVSELEWDGQNLKKNVILKDKNEG